MNITQGSCRAGALDRGTSPSGKSAEASSKYQGQGSEQDPKDRLGDWATILVSPVPGPTPLPAPKLTDTSSLDDQQYPFFLGLWALTPSSFPPATPPHTKELIPPAVSGIPLIPTPTI